MEVKPDTGRVTQGIPSLDPSKRFQRDTAFVKHERARSIEADQKEKLELAVEKDGDRPIDVKAACRGMVLSSSELIKRLTRLNNQLWFARSETVPSQMMCCLRVPISEDHPKGLKYIGGFPADIPVSEMTFYCTKERWAHTRMGTLEKIKEPCKGCADCMFLRQIPGWRTLLERLIVAGIVSRARCENAFGVAGIDSRNLWRARNA